MVRFFALLLLVPALLAANEATAKDAIAMVEKGVKLIQSQGTEKAFAAFEDKANTEFHQGELYLLVYDLEGKCLSHGANLKFIGKNRIDVEDVNGKLYLKDMVTMAKGKGKGWVDYYFKNPETGKIGPKTTYLFKVDGKDFIVCCGIYK